jgi:hypothetical protein
MPQRLDYDVCWSKIGSFAAKVSQARKPPTKFR